MNSKCFVPNCKNTVGVSFPEDSELKKQWLNSLRIKYVIPNQSSFVCLDHFEENDVYDSMDAEGTPLKCIRQGAIPSVVASKQGDKFQPDHNDKPVACYKNKKFLDSNKQLNEHNDVRRENNKDTAQKHIQDVNSQEGNIKDEKEISSELESLKPNTLNSSIKKTVDEKLCRLCGKQGPYTKNIFEEKIENVLVSVAIMECIYPIEILQNDKLSKHICLSCLNTLTSYFKFRCVCLENDKRQRDLYNEDDRKITEAIICASTSKDSKRKLSHDSSSDTVKKQRIEDHIYTDTEDDYSDQDDLDSLSDFMVKKEVVDPPDKPDEDTVQFVDEHLPEDTKQSPSEIDKKFNKVEEELRKVLEGQLTEEQAQAENIIIHVENDEEERSPDKLATLKNLKLPIVIKPLNNGQNKGVINVNLNNRKIIQGDSGKIQAKILRTDSKLVTLPKGIKLCIKDIFKSAVGILEGAPVEYLFDTEFFEVDGYLYEYRLCKGNSRYMRCVLPVCPALAIQTKIKPGEYSTEVTVQTGHTHKRPNAAEKKKQMFYYVMKRKILSDKTLNFRSVYDEVCKRDPEIKELVPLRNVINEICRHQLTYKTPQIMSFEHFFDHIEDDAFQKLHFTHNGRQFYQEKFKSEDDSRAIVFANSDIIEQVSYSNLMYVDSSFKIDTREDFKYQLVTVLVWIDDSYYPILYAVVNYKTQEIYKKIFEYLHDTLAPKLRPEEIVTDYEANLYYALGETYLNSSIGGSVFYYTQNLYKKICALNLSRDLETNSYFRNIYHMLLMLPLLPVNTILDGLNNMEIQARDLGLADLTKAIFDHVRTEWIVKVTPDLFCVHRLENRINENVIAPFKKLRDFIMLSKGKMQKQNTNIITVVEKLIELEHFLQITYSMPNKKSFARDLSSSQKKNVLKAWQYIESHPKININNFFSKVLGYIKCMENQLWIWGFYRYEGGVTDDLINATNFSIVSNDVEVETQNNECEEQDPEFVEGEEMVAEEGESGQVVMEAVIDENGSFVLQNKESGDQPTQFENAFLKYVYKQ